MAKKTPVSQIVSWLVFMMMACGFSPLPLIASAPAMASAECKALAISLASEDPAVARVGRMLASRVEEHAGVKSTFSQAPGACRVELALQKGIGEEGFRIEAAPGGVRVVGNDRRGLLYGAGKFLRSNTYHEGSLTLGDWRGTSVPETPFRGIYFATHFFNWYHEAPIPEVERYVEDLGLWGYNTVVVWYDMHHFKSIQDPEAQALLKRLNSLLRVAKNVGLQTSIVLVVNEAYQDAPQEMLADWTGGHDGYTRQLGAHYHLELCPNKPGAMALLLKWREEVFAAFKQVGLDYIGLWPYDTGGCTCSLCKPWGVNGYLKLAQPIAEMARRDFPGCKIILSTWYYDKFTPGEWDGLERKFDQAKPEWIDYIMADDKGVKRYSINPKHRVPGGFPLLSFPEISMWGATPWGGFGANPLPARHQELWNIGKNSLSGGYPYSEGIFEDLNKVLFAQFFWRKDRPASSIVDEYAAYEFSPEVVPLVDKAVEIMERNYPRSGENINKPAGPVRFTMKQTSGADEALKLVEQADRMLTSRERKWWRWRIFYLRGGDR